MKYSEGLSVEEILNNKLKIEYLFNRITGIIVNVLP